VLIFAQRDPAYVSLQGLAAELASMGSSVLLLSAGEAVRAEKEPVLELLSMLLRFYLLVNAAALKLGRSPDNPPLLSKVTETR
jgi:fructoselysine-6-P-deglycase FrlB-like protein